MLSSSIFSHHIARFYFFCCITRFCLFSARFNAAVTWKEDTDDETDDSAENDTCKASADDQQKTALL